MNYNVKNNNNSEYLKKISLEKFQNIGTYGIKTTNINILLNRVKKNKNAELKKKMIFTSSLIILISFVAALVL